MDNPPRLLYAMILLLVFVFLAVVVIWPSGPAWLRLMAFGAAVVVGYTAVLLTWRSIKDHDSKIYMERQAAAALTPEGEADRWEAERIKALAAGGEALYRFLQHERLRVEALLGTGDRPPANWGIPVPTSIGFVPYTFAVKYFDDCRGRSQMIPSRNYSDSLDRQYADGLIEACLAYRYAFVRRDQLGRRNGPIYWAPNGLQLVLQDLGLDDEPEG